MNVVEGNVKFQIQVSFLQLCKIIRNPTKIIVTVWDGICNGYGLQGFSGMDLAKLDHPIPRSSTVLLAGQKSLSNTLCTKRILTLPYVCINT